MAPLLQDTADLGKLPVGCADLDSPAPSQTPTEEEDSSTTEGLAPETLTSESGLDSHLTRDRDSPVTPVSLTGEGQVGTTMPDTPPREDMASPCYLVPSPPQVHLALHNLPPHDLSAEAPDLHLRLQGLSISEGKELPVAPWGGEPSPWESDPGLWAPGQYIEEPIAAVPGQVVGTVEDFHALVSAGMVLPAPGSHTQGPMVFWGPDHEGRFIGGPATLLPGYYLMSDKTADWQNTQHPVQGEIYNNYGYEEYYSEPCELNTTSVEDISDSRTRRNSVDSGHAESDLSLDNASGGFETVPVDGLCDTDNYDADPGGEYVEYKEGYYGNQPYGYHDNQYYGPELQQGVLYTSPGWGVVEESPCYIASSTPYEQVDTGVPYLSYQA